MSQTVAVSYTITTSSASDYVNTVQYRSTGIDGTVLMDYTGVGVVTSQGAGNLYMHVQDGVTMPDTGGYIDWRTDNTTSPANIPLGSLNILPAPPTVVQIRTEMDDHSIKLEDIKILEDDWKVEGRLNNILDQRADQLSVNALINDTNNLKSTVDALQMVVNRMNTDLTVIQSDILGMKNSVQRMESSVSDMETDVENVKTTTDKLGMDWAVDGPLDKLLKNRASQNSLETALATLNIVTSTASRIDTSTTAIDSIVTDMQNDVTMIDTTTGTIHTTVDNIQWSGLSS